MRSKKYRMLPHQLAAFAYRYCDIFLSTVINNTHDYYHPPFGSHSLFRQYSLICWLEGWCSLNAQKLPFWDVAIKTAFAFLPNKVLSAGLFSVKIHLKAIHLAKKLGCSLYSLWKYIFCHVPDFKKSYSIYDVISFKFPFNNLDFTLMMNCVSWPISFWSILFFGFCCNPHREIRFSLFEIDLCRSWCVVS